MTLDEDLRPLSWLLGTWEGTAEGEPGTGRQTRRYEPALRGRVIQGTNTTVWEPKAPDAEPEVHEDLSFLSYDRGAKRFVLHVFYVERFVAEHAGEPLGDRALRFTSERVQNGPPGMRSRETLALHDDALECRFEIAMPGGEFALYTREILRRIS